MKIPSSFYVKARICCKVAALMFLMCSETLLAQELTAQNFKKLSLEELMNVEVTSVSKRTEKLRETASAIQIITQKDIHNSGVKTLPEALRLASNLQVAQVNSSQWAISARGFNNVLANKLLVMIDGRSVYTPLYAGVFWDIQNVLLEDVDRIEVISGPGGTLWGANAVNGVINIITKSAKDTKGLLVEAATGSVMPGLGSLRYGGQVNKDLAYRVYGTGFKLGNTLETDGSESGDNWSMLQGGLQIDWSLSDKDQLTLRQNLYGGKPNPNPNPKPANSRGDNAAIRWNRVNSDKFSLHLSGYYDHTLRDFNSGFTEDLKTFDLDWGNQLQMGERHLLSFGAGFRLMDHKVSNLEVFRFLPEQKTLYLFNIYAQDEIQLVKDRLKLTIGSKIEHNSYTGFEYQPNGRLTWTPAKNHTVWSAVSRAVRTPARIDRDFSLDLPSGIPIIVSNDDYVSATVIAYELGWRLQPVDNTSISLATFYNTYNNIRSVEPLTAALFPVVFGNGVKGNTYGAELSATYQPMSWWNLRGGYTFVRKELSLKSGSRDSNKATAESNDPTHQVLIQSNITLPAKLELGTVIRFVDKLPNPYVKAYTALDLRLGWHLNKMIELNLVGQNLLDKRHAEFIPDSPSARLIERSVYGKITFRY